MSQNVPTMLENTISKIREMVDVNNVVGEPIVVGDVTIVPVSKVSVGFGGGGSDFVSRHPNKESNPFGGGVGGGIILEGKVYAGFNFAGAELGHTVIEKDGRQCSCGRRGCWETYSSATGLITTTKEKILACREKKIPTLMEKLICGDLARISGKTAFTAAKQDDKAGREVVDTYIDYLACGIANMINIFQPEVLSIGGGICHEGDYLLTPLKERVFKEVYTKEREPKTKLVIAELGNDAGIIGAASLGW